ncbi:MAG: EF-Tu/IF-2/RF-3 family GTPase [Bacteroidota bacterium]
MKFFLYCNFLLLSMALTPFLVYSQQPAFIMGVEDVFNMPGIGAMVTGTIESGTVEKGMKLELLGKGDSVYLVSVVMINRNRSQLNTATKGDTITLNLRGVKAADIKRGMVLSHPGIFKRYTEVELSLRLLPANESGQKESLKSGQRVLLAIRSDLVSAVVTVLNPPKEIRPGETGTTRLVFQEPVPVLVNDSVSFKIFNRTFGTALVTNLIR